MNKSLSATVANKVPGRPGRCGDFPPCTSNDMYTNWFTVDGHPAVQYQHSNGTWAQVVQHIEAETGMDTYDVQWSGQPGEVRTIYDKAEAVAFAKWLARP